MTKSTLSHLLVLVVAVLVGAYAVQKVPQINIIGRIIP
jgi:hypothetical protein